MKVYTGVGSRNIPERIFELMVMISAKLCRSGWVLRSGGAHGSDTAFENGVLNYEQKKIFYADDCTENAMYIARCLHPAWNRLSPYAMKLHGRNAMQVLGADLRTPSKFLICWTPDGALTHSERTQATGGTGTAISIADKNNIPVYNLKRKDHLSRVEKWLDEK